MRVFVDANVFVSTWTLDILLSFAQRRLFEPVFSNEVVAEYLSAVASRPGGARGADMAARDPWSGQGRARGAEKATRDPRGSAWELAWSRKGDA